VTPARHERRTNISDLAARVPQEEQMMLERFGDDYRDYMRRTGRFFPRQRLGHS
jgi:steroid 5-alpha reductase family enzyme